MVVDHDESESAKNDYGFKNFTRVSQSFVQGSFADRNDLNKLLLGVEKDNSQGFVTEKTHFSAECV